MTSILDKLPTILTLAVLVGIFLALRKHSTSARIRLWTYAWALIFIHFLIQVFETHTGTIEQIVESIDLGALELSGVVFVVSMCRTVEDRFHRRLLLALFGVPTVFHAVVVTFDWHIRGALIAAIAVLSIGGAAYTIAVEGFRSKFAMAIAAILLATGTWAIRDQWLGSSDFAVTAILTLTFLLCGPLFWRRVPRWSPGVLAVVAGFVAWGAVFPAGALMDHFYPELAVNPELWNVPKFLVAIGMVLTLLEDQSMLVEQSRAREHAENLLLHRLSQISSRLLAGRDPAALCGEIAEGITTASSFRRVAIFLVGEDRVLSLASASGIPQEERAWLEVRARTLSWEKYQEVCGAGERLGNNSFVLEAEKLARLRGMPVNSVPGRCVILIPLVSPRGWHVGCLWLSTNQSPGEVSTNELAKLEMLAADLAVTIENTRLHHQLVRTEKLAALGQLVAGVAHELNNPLTGILGYSELLLEDVEKESTRARIGKLGHEARRMQRIVDGLLRFARQNNPAARSTNLSAALRDAIQLREYHIRKFGIRMDVELNGDLPSLGIGEDELKQVLLNLLNNAIDAVEESKDRTIRVYALRHDDRVAIHFEDSGPGFAELNRAFDPFYTTKPVGKGTGLGLSICYGIVQECGGEIVITNKLPFGASVVIEIPAALVAAPVFPLLAE
ncbi:MAG: ATP-binding protein [Candidatus Acidiferrales bacterium]